MIHIKSYTQHYHVLILCSIIQAEMRWDPGAGNCASSSAAHFLSNIIVMLVCELTLLLVMFFGVQRKRSESKLWRLLHRQVCCRAIVCLMEDVSCDHINWDFYLTHVQSILWILLVFLSKLPMLVRTLYIDGLLYFDCCIGSHVSQSEWLVPVSSF